MLKVQKVFDKEKTEVKVLQTEMAHSDNRKGKKKETKEMLKQRVNLVRKKLKGQIKDADEQLEKNLNELKRINVQNKNRSGIWSKFLK